MRARIAIGAAWLAAVWALVVVVAGGAATPGYSHVAQYISELGATGAAAGTAVSLGGFLPIGLLALVALLASAGRDERPVPMGSAYVWLYSLPLAYLASAFARCDAGCAGVTLSQALHNLFGVGGYVGGAVALFVAGSAELRLRHGGYGLLMIGLSLVVLVSLWTFGAPSPLGAVRGIAQRVSEVILFGFLVTLVRARWRDVPADTVRPSR